MKTQVMDCFDDVIQKRILKLNEKLDSISPDNINYIDSSIIESVAILNNKINNLNFTYTGDSMINSVDTFKINSLITKCKARIMRFSVQAVLTIPAIDGTQIALGDYLQSLGGNSGEIEVMVPESFSGLRSFILTHPNPEGATVFRPNHKHKFWCSKSDRHISFHFKRYWVEQIYILYWK